MTAQHEFVPTTHPAIAVLGATGAVGAQVAATLHAKGHHVITVSRHLNRADGSRTRLDRVRGEFTDPASIGDITPGVAVNCTGIEDLNSVQRWRDAGWAVIDITASSQYANDLANATHDGPPLIVGVGLTPGLTSVLARHLVANDLDATSVTITCLVGLGEDYGDASRDWTYRQLGRHINGPTEHSATSPTGYYYPKNSTLRSPPGTVSTPVSLGESSQSPAPSRKPPRSSAGSTSCHVERSAVPHGGPAA